MVLPGGRMSLNCTCDNLAQDPSPTDRELQDALRDFRGFNLTVASLAVIILIVTSVVCSISYHRRRRQCQQARFYENAIKSYERSNPSGVTELKKMQITDEPQTFSNKKSNGENSCPIYFIYDNPMALTLDEGITGEPEHLPEADQGARVGIGTGDGCKGNISKGINTDPQVVFV